MYSVQSVLMNAHPAQANISLEQFFLEDVNFAKDASAPLTVVRIRKIKNADPRT